MYVIDKLPKLLLMKDKPLELVALNLLFNLSFDSKLRDKMVRVGFLPKLVSMLGKCLPLIKHKYTTTLGCENISNSHESNSQLFDSIRGRFNYFSVLNIQTN